MLCIFVFFNKTLGVLWIIKFFCFRSWTYVWQGFQKSFWETNGDSKCLIQLTQQSKYWLLVLQILIVTLQLQMHPNFTNRVISYARLIRVSTCRTDKIFWSHVNRNKGFVPNVCFLGWTNVCIYDDLLILWFKTRLCYISQDWCYLVNLDAWR